MQSTTPQTAQSHHPNRFSATAELSIDKLIAKAGEAPVIKLVDLILRQAIDERASDIHIEPYKDKIVLRYRIDGKLYQIPPPASHLQTAIVSRIKILAKLDIAEKRLPQDGAISAKLEDRTVDLRISTIPTVWGEKVVMRILDKGAIPMELTDWALINCKSKNPQSDQITVWVTLCYWANGRRKIHDSLRGDP